MRVHVEFAWDGEDNCQGEERFPHPMLCKLVGHVVPFPEVRVTGSRDLWAGDGRRDRVEEGKVLDGQKRF